MGLSNHPLNNNESAPPPLARVRTCLSNRSFASAMDSRMMLSSVLGVVYVLLTSAWDFSSWRNSA